MWIRQNEFRNSNWFWNKLNKTESEYEQYKVMNEQDLCKEKYLLKIMMVWVWNEMKWNEMKLLFLEHDKITSMICLRSEKKNSILHVQGWTGGILADF